MAKMTKLAKINEARHAVITPVFRVSFPNVFKPKLNELSDKTEYSLDMIFDSKEAFKEEYKGKKKQTVSLLKAVANAKADQWGADKTKWPEFKNKTFKNGDENVSKKDGEIRKGYEGKVYLTAKSDEKFPPKVVLANGEPADEKAFYGGCYARAQVIARPYEMGGNCGVRFILKQLIKVKDGERFGGIAEDVFDVEEMSEEALEGDSNEEDSEGDDF